MSVTEATDLGPSVYFNAYSTLMFRRRNSHIVALELADNSGGLEVIQRTIGWVYPRHADDEEHAGYDHEHSYTDGSAPALALFHISTQFHRQI